MSYFARTINTQKKANQKKMEIRAGQCNNNLQNKHNKNIQVTASKLGMIHSSTLNHSKMATHQERPRMLIERKQCEMNDPEFVSSEFCGLPFRKRTPPEID
jgi:hypothetical protein